MEKLYSILQQLASEMGENDLEFKVEMPKEKSHGDLSTNLALVLAKKLNKNPMEIAEDIVSKLITDESFISDIQIAAPGFINFYYSHKFLEDNLRKILDLASDYGSLKLGEGKKASVEYVSANPTGPLHIGNARGGPIGDVLANVLFKAGYSVTREYLHNNVGGQITKLGESIYFSLNPDKLVENAEIQYQGEYIKELASLVESKIGKDLDKDEFIPKAGEIAVEYMLTEILEDCRKMGINFDKITKESDLRLDIPQVLEKIKPSLKENEGALWFAPNDEFLKDRETVVKKSNAEYTYFASDIAYHAQKMANYDLALDIWGSNHSGHVPRIQAVVKALGFNPENLKFILYQWVRLKRGEEVVKMSKRAGNFVTAREVLDEVGKDAFRFFLLMPRSQTHMDFDLELAKKKASDNPVYYVQYAYTRISSIFAKIEEPNLTEADLSLLATDEEVALIRLILEFPQLIERILETLEVNSLTTYAIEIANCFHRFYEKHRVVSNDTDITKARLVLAKATQITLKNTLDLLGVTALETM